MLYKFGKPIYTQQISKSISIDEVKRRPRSHIVGEAISSIGRVNEIGSITRFTNPYASLLHELICRRRNWRNVIFFSEELQMLHRNLLA